MSKQLPAYLENILMFMAESEARHGKISAQKAYETFRRELIEESLTAKANPSPAAIPASTGTTDVKLRMQIKNIEESLKRHLPPAKKAVLAIQLHRLIDQLLNSDDFIKGDKNRFKLRKAQLELHVLPRMLSRRPTPQSQVREESVANPTVKPFHEIYDALGDEFNSSPLGKTLGGLGKTINNNTKKHDYETTAGDKSAGRRVFEEIRNLSFNTANEIVEFMYGGRKGREGNSRKKIPHINSAGEYGPGGLKKIEDIHDRNVEQNHVESMRYLKLLIASLMAASIRPLFEMRQDELNGLFQELLEKPRNFNATEFEKDPLAAEKEYKKLLMRAAMPSSRKAFVEKVFDLMRERDGIIKAALQTTRYIGKKKVGGEIVASNIITQLLEIDELKK